MADLLEQRIPDETFAESFTQSLGMVVLSEIGDKTFFMAAVLAMRYGKSRVFLGCWTALVLMTGLSTALGWAAPQLIPDYFVHWAAVFLFFVFGVRMSYQAAFYEEPKVSELAEVEAELQGQDFGEGSQSPSRDATSKGNGSPVGVRDLRQRKPEEQPAADADPPSKGASPSRAGTPAAQKTAARRLLSPVVFKSFALTFLAEWGDRSQMATIG